MNVLYLILLLIILMIFLFGIVMLQIFLSNRENKWAGLILPTISAINAILPLIRMTVSNNNGHVNVIAIVPIVMAPIIFMGIYLVCRKKFKSQKEIDKMNIQDLY